jgi:hypothetical protein
MSTDLAVVLALLAAAVVMFALNRPRMDAVALIMMIALPLVALAGDAGPGQPGTPPPAASVGVDRGVWPG